MLESYSQIAELIESCHPLKAQPVVNGTVLITVPRMEGEKPWAKNIDFVDPYVQGGNAFQGTWVQVGLRQYLPLGALIVCGCKVFGNGVYRPQRRLFCVTGLGRVWLEDESSGYASRLIEMPVRDRLELVIDSRGRASRGRIEQLMGVKGSEFPDMSARAESLIDAYKTELEWVTKFLSGEIGQVEVKDVASAAMEIVRAGYRAMALKYHPDHGGSDEKMSLLNDANMQLKEMLNAVLG